MGRDPLKAIQERKEVGEGRSSAKKNYKKGVGKVYASNVGNGGVRIMFVS